MSLPIAAIRRNDRAEGRFFPHLLDVRSRSAEAPDDVWWSLAECLIGQVRVAVSRVLRLRHCGADDSRHYGTIVLAELF